jgi:8-oxo-dGTP pyrophosphatase MutT (NUDIX family)
VRRTYDFDFFKVKWFARYGWIMDRSPAVVIVPIAPDDRIWLLQIDRPPTGTRSWEFPGGGVDGGEDPITAGLRELEEECGLVARRARVLPTVFEIAPGMGRFPHRVVIAKGVVPRGRRPVPQKQEGIVAARSFDRAGVRRLIRGGRISVASTLVALAASGWMDGAREQT